MLKDFSVPSLRRFGGRSGASTPARRVSPTSESDGSTEEERQKEKTWKRKKPQIIVGSSYMTRHVAKIIGRQEFIMNEPSHRLQSQIKSTENVLQLELSCIYLLDVLLISFDDNSTSMSNVKPTKALEAYRLYWKVIHDKLYVSDASAELDLPMRRPQLCNRWKLIVLDGLCSGTICTVSFAGSFIDSLIVFPLGALLIVIQLLSVRNELYSNVFEVAVTTLFSFLAAALASTRLFCYSAVASSSVVLMPPVSRIPPSGLRVSSFLTVPSKSCRARLSLDDELRELEVAMEENTSVPEGITTFIQNLTATL
ncbi:hypothetical protein D9615_008579 [Tricholomella constricta]|uniref:Threonine/serine exporter-like N-terminal domain-containing protein n=1 Tax=Tricholomella constricta TaxID=117010 RepID=A0A8H5M092_9AGAR|nr:hypothetical protein D9615_008579 [Tricholomella constricta]